MNHSMRSLLFIVLSLLIVPSAHAKSGLRRLRQNVDESEQEGVNNEYLGLAKEVNGQAWHRVLLHAVKGARKMIGFQDLGIMEETRDRLFDAWIAAGESNNGPITPPSPPPAHPTPVHQHATPGPQATSDERSMSMSMSMGMMSMSTDMMSMSMETSVVMSMSMSSSMSM